MKKNKDIKNIAASVRERLRNISIESGKEFQSIVRQYIHERFLYRLSVSEYSENLILKGALLFVAHNISRSRPTKDIDFLGTSVSNEKEVITEILKEIINAEFGDGLTFDTDSTESEDIVEDGDYHGVRVKFFVFLEQARERVQIDIGFGDHITNGPVEIDFPTLLDFPAPRLKVYSLESAIAEKFEAIVSLQLQTSRMKDFYDILFFAENHVFQMDTLRQAILTTFEHRSTDIENRKFIFCDEFRTDERLQKYWTAFLDRSKLSLDRSFSSVVIRVQEFIEPVFSGKNKTWNPLNFRWE